MKCPEFDRRLQETLDRRALPSQDADLRDHAARCEACRQSLAAHEALLAGLRGGRRPEPRADLADAVVARFVAESAAERAVALPARPALPWPWLAVAGVAAAALVLVAFSPAWRPRDPAQGPTTVQAPAQEPAQRQLPEERKAQRGKLALARPGKASPASDPDPLRPNAPLAGSASVDPAYDYEQYRDALFLLAAHWPEAMEQVEAAPGFRPLRTTFGLAWDALCRAMPGRDDRYHRNQSWLAPSGVPGELS